MNIEIRGIWSSNKGSELMLRAIVDALAHMGSETRFVVEVGRASYDQRVLYGLYQKGPELLTSELHKRLGDLVPGRIRRLLGIVTAHEAQGLLGRLAKDCGIVTEEEIDAVLDASGFAYGEQWGPNKAETMARLAERWKRTEKSISSPTQAFGPFESERLRSAVKRILGCVDLAYARDSVSYEHLRELGVASDIVHVAPDFTSLVEGRIPDHFDPTGEQVCIVPNQKMVEMTSDDVGSRYVQFLVSCVRYLSTRGFSTHVLVHETSLDEELALHLQTQCGQEVDIIREPDPVCLKGVLGSCYLVVGSRYHALAGALSEGVPCLGTGWSHKYQTLFEEYDCLENLVSPTEPFDQVGARLDALTEQRYRAELVKKLRGIAGARKRITAEMWAEVESVLLR